MAAAVKMDELLVRWLGSDSMYETVLSLIEENKLAAQKQQQQSQAATPAAVEETTKEGSGSGNVEGAEEDITTSVSTKNNSGDPNATSTINNNDNDNEDDDDEENNSQGNSITTTASPRCVIPKFYLRDPSKPRRRRLLLPMPQSDTWEPLPEGERQPEEHATEHSNSNAQEIMMGEENAANNNNNNNDSVNHSTAHVNANANTNAAPVVMCVRDQVQAVFKEIGQPMVSTNNTNNGSDSPIGDVRQLFITVQDFVRITKEIFRFPTFFNVPLCQRLLWLWRQHNNNKSTSEEEEQEQQPPRPSMIMMEEPSPEEPITYEMVEWYWHQEMEPYDYQERFFRLCKQPQAEYIVRDDFLPFIKALLNDHPVSTLC